MGKVLEKDLDKRNSGFMHEEKDAGNKQTATILVCFMNMNTHDEMLSKWSKLRIEHKFKRVWINLDERFEFKCKSWLF